MRVGGVGSGFGSLHICLPTVGLCWKFCGDPSRSGWDMKVWFNWVARSWQMRLSEVGSDLASYLFAHCGPMLKISWRSIKIWLQLTDWTNLRNSLNWLTEQTDWIDWTSRQNWLTELTDGTDWTDWYYWKNDGLNWLTQFKNRNDWTDLLYWLNWLTELTDWTDWLNWLNWLNCLTELTDWTNQITWSMIWNNGMGWARLGRAAQE